MGVGKGPWFDERDVFVDYPFEDVMFRWDHVAEKVYKRFYGEPENPEPVRPDNRLFNDALRFGDEITREQYEKGKPRG